MTKDQQINAVLEVVAAVGDAIKALGSVPSGHLYARLSDKLSLENYNLIIGTLKATNLVAERNHMLTWIGGV